MSGNRLKVDITHGDVTEITFCDDGYMLETDGYLEKNNTFLNLNEKELSSLAELIGWDVSFERLDCENRTKISFREGEDSNTSRHMTNVVSIFERSAYA